MGIYNDILSSIIQVSLFSAIPFLWWLFRYRKEEGFFSWVGLKKPIIKGSSVRLVTRILIVAIIYVFLMGLIITYLLKDVAMATNEFYGKGLKALPSIFVFSIVKTALSEEVFFRGFLGKRFINSFGFVKGNTVQAMAFGLLHGLPFGLATGSLLTTIILTVIPGAIGWFQGWINEKCATGSIIPSWILHSTMNILSSLSSAM